jgi:site-specific recombinase XerD
VTALAPTLQAFFTQRLIGQRGASECTIAAYRDTWRLLLGFASRRTGKNPCQLDIADLDAPLITAFLDHLEHDRGNSARTRNNRLAAIRSLFAWAALRHPEHAATIQRVLAISPKRFQRNLVTYLTGEETDALIAACDKRTWTGRRDHALIVLAVQAGLRISELAALTTGDITLGVGAHVHTIGKGEKNAAPRSFPQLPPCCAPGSPNAKADPATRCSPPAPAGRSAETPSNSASASTPPKPPRPAPPCDPSTSPPTPSGTPAP